MICRLCRKPFVARFEVTHYGLDGKMRASVQLCSIACVIKWAIGYGVALGRRSVQLMLKGLPVK
jgi:hypothetical protein